jgi:hypothetical protein
MLPPWINKNSLGPVIPTGAAEALRSGLLVAFDGYILFFCPDIYKYTIALRRRIIISAINITRAEDL